MYTAGYRRVGQYVTKGMVTKGMAPGHAGFTRICERERARKTDLL